MSNNREYGILLHPTSLTGKYGIGELGQEAYNFIDFLSRSGQTLWQTLPLGPIGYGESPYQSYSAFAGNPLLISLDKLKEQGLLEARDLYEAPSFPEEEVAYDLVIGFKDKALRKAFANFEQQLQALKGEATGLKDKKIIKLNSGFALFLEENQIWLDKFSLFMALKKHFNGAAWNYWDQQIAFREQEAVSHYQKLLTNEVRYQAFLQYIFYTQWQELHAYATGKGVKIIGDLPIFVSYDSSDAWANPELFQLDLNGNPLKVAGVPPDYFSETGQLWGNPHYNWQLMKEQDYSWWRERLTALLTYVDIVRIDHFRGFEAYWEIPGEEKTAVNGRWVKGPGAHFFATMEKHLGQLPIIAEDLGIITPEVVAL
ncbi:MAG: 4-alpha-glucanotransferase, partial [Bacillota bacterium]|nr:4-alpha-glucanotransferase [Bacillota bacterium]